MMSLTKPDLGAEERFSRHPGKPIAKRATQRIVQSSAPPYAFAYARTALKFGLRAIGLTAGDELLVPEFVCESLIHPLTETGIEPKYYRVDSNLHPDWIDARSRLSSHTRGIVLVHYFGQSNDIASCTAFCRAHDLLLIEDNAHGFGASYQGQQLGTFGNAGISAPRKSFPVRNGAFLYLSEASIEDLSTLLPQPDERYSLRRRLRQHGDRIPVMNRLMAWQARRTERSRRRGPAPPYHRQDAFRDLSPAADYGMDAEAAAFLQTVDLRDARKKRQDIYNIWLEWAMGHNVQPLFDKLDENAMPLVFPGLVSGPEDSRRWFETGHRNGIDIHSWPTFPLDIVNRNDDAMRLWERLVCFPIHQYMDKASLIERLGTL